jgi:two-component system phosphate regulon sensor histidine kinase PhoR
MFSWYVAIVLALGLLISFYAFRTIRRHFIDTQAQNLENLAQTLKFKIQPLMESGRLEELESFIKDFGREIQTRITIVGSEGTVLADSEEDPKEMENHRFRPEIYQALQDRTGRAIRWSSTVRQDMLYVGLALEEGGKTIGVLRVSLFLKDVQNLIAKMKKDLGRAVVILLLLMVAVAFFVSRGLSRPVKELIVASRKVALGDFSVRVGLKTKGELRGLAESFNLMTAEIRGLFGNLTGQKEELESILSSIQEGLLVLDKNGRVILANQSFKQIVQNNLIEGMFYWEVVLSSRFGDLITKAGMEKSNVQGEFSLNEKDYMCSAAFLPSPERIVVTVYNLT